MYMSDGIAGVTEDPAYLGLLDVVLACHACREAARCGSLEYEAADDTFCEAKHRFETHLEHCVDVLIGRVARALVNPH
jgi:hypothetical protein